MSRWGQEKGLPVERAASAEAPGAATLVSITPREAPLPRREAEGWWIAIMAVGRCPCWSPGSAPRAKPLLDLVPAFPPPLLPSPPDTPGHSF